MNQLRLRDKSHIYLPVLPTNRHSNTHIVKRGSILYVKETDTEKKAYLLPLSG
jgi:hypothetical protein